VNLLKKFRIRKDAIIAKQIKCIDLILCVMMGRSATQFFLRNFSLLQLFFFNNTIEFYCFYRILRILRILISVKKNMKSLVVNCKNKIYKNK